MNAQELWTATQHILAAQVTRGTFDYTIALTQALDYNPTAQILTLAAPNNQVVDWLRGQLDTSIRRAVSEITGSPTIITYQTIPQRHTDLPIPHTPDPVPQVLDQTVQVTDRRGNFFMLENVIMDDYFQFIGSSGLAVYCLYARMANRQDMAWPSFRTICKQLHIGPATLTAVNTLLEILGLIEIQHGDQEHSNRYTLLPTKPLDLLVIEEIKQRLTLITSFPQVDRRKLTDTLLTLPGYEGGTSPAEAGCFSDRSRVLLVQKQGASAAEAEQDILNNTQKISDPVVVLGPQLLNIGVDHRTALDLITRHTPARIAGWLAYTLAQKGIRNRAGFLISRLESGDPVPEPDG